MADEQSSNGGLTALAGYLYQTVGVLGMKAGAYQLANLTGSADLEVLLTLARQSPVYYEYLDQDAAIRQSLGLEVLDTFVLVQFKFSRQIPVPKISPGELKEILGRLRSSTRRAQQLGQQISGYALISNRELGPEAQQMLHNAQTADPPQRNSNILRQLRVLPPISKTSWEGALREFARTYGCLDSEIQKGIDEGVGSIIRQTVDRGSPLITKAGLIGAFTGFPGARQLTPSSVAEQSRIQLDTFFAQRHFQQKHMLVRRTVLDTISQLSEEHAIVIVYGLGGNGKTVSLWHWMEEFLSSSVPQQRGAYTAILAAEDVQASCLTHVLCDWANLPADHGWRENHRPQYVFERLRVASPGAKHPIFYLEVDAIDEEQNLSDGTRHAIKQLLKWFWEEELAIHRSGRFPQATIILTCRDEMEIARRWLYLNSPFGDTAVRLPSVAVNDFEPEELLEAAQRGLQREFFARIEKALFPEEKGFSSPGDIPLLQKVEPILQPVDQQILLSLRHPALWRCFIIEEPSIQSRVLDGDPGALQQLAKRYVFWFCSKAEMRGHALKNDELEHVLAVIARDCQGSGRMHYDRRQWIDTACSTQLIATVGAERLYNEAISAGLIEKIDRETWYWRHRFVNEYLIAISGV